ncbi:ABC transporter ATP-binding protein [Pseudoxanthomonas koreensis]|uniref:ABC transporter ATP-binding protein n=1 Tax=Pseudoxanthomonas koreensis TaxID=266061 RepID=UPI001391CDAD|nr:ABC transporter ATP-binding protein [Pseudoxanthomonas koreensis]KAF1691587.1 ABC transporter ATP-binding protein [Pseudoxanthomonas koreensis]
MSCEDSTIEISNLRKAYRIFDKPSSRLWHMLFRGHQRFYREHVALDDVSFKVSRGETVGVVGRNGSGKSTLLSVICGTLLPSSGTVAVSGRVAALLELGAGFNPELNGRENIDLCAQIYGLDADDLDNRRDSIIAFADIGDHIDQPVKTYSSGMFTRLAFAVIAHVDADILVIDEALAVGDAYFVQKCMRYLRAFRDGGGTLLFVSHDMGAITALCDRAIWLVDGRVNLDSDPKRIAEAYLADLYRQQQVVEAIIGSASEARGASSEEIRLDPRRELVVNSNLRNDLEIREFAALHDFGAGGAQIVDSALRDQSGAILSWVVGGELVVLSVDVVASQEILELIVGFVVKDKNGQPLFGDNTYLSMLDSPMRVAAGDRARVEFEFQMPILPSGVYAISLAVSEGTQKSHTVHQWVHEAILLTSTASSIATGLVGIPMRRIGVVKMSDKAGTLEKP